MVTSEKVQKTTPRLLIRRRLLLLLLLRLSTTIEEATHELSGHITNTSRAAARMRTLTTMLSTQK